VDPASFLRASRVVIVAGKGGVGKTTVTAVLARRASDEGLRTLVIETEGRTGLAGLLGAEPFGYEPQVVRPASTGVGEIVGRTIRPDDALVEWLGGRGLGRLTKRLAQSGVLDVVATAVPGIRDILVLGKIKQVEKADGFDVVLVDGPAAGHAISFLQAAGGLLDSVQVGPVRAQASDVQELLTDPTRCSVVLVTVPEETPVSEAAETAFALEDRVGVALGPIVVNGLDTPPPGLDAPPPDGPDADALAAAATHRLARAAAQQVQLQRLGQLLPLDQFRLPLLFRADLGPEEVGELAAALG
jgi:anion-transporting  ArsA/GET3 family ATPase